MSRVEQIGDARLILGDCRELLPELRADVVISDPPYSIPHNFPPHHRSDGSIRTLSWDWDDQPAEQIVEVFRPLCRRVSAAFIFCGSRQVTPLALALAGGGLVDKMACWAKPYPPPPAPGNWWPSAFELAVYGYRPGAFFGDTDPSRSNVFRHDALRHGNGEKNGHPTQKPLALMERLVNAIARYGAVVLDPFMGSGTTGVAALRLGRRFIGVEIEARWFDIACRRIEAEARQPRLFTEPAPKPKQEALL